MARSLLRPALLALVMLTALTAMGCGGSRSEGVAIEWRVSDGASAETRVGGDALKTTVYLSNSTGSTLHDAHIRFAPAEIRGAPVGLSVGTMTHVSTRFDGDDHVWPLGDIEPGQRIAFPLGLWFSNDLSTSGSQTVDLVVELESEDLPVALASNAVTVKLNP